MKKTFKIIKIILWIIIILEIILIIVKIANKNKTNSVKDKNEVIELKKIYENRDYVYDAKYESNSNYEDRAYTINNKEYKISDLIVPYINIDNSYAQRANDRIKKLYNDYVKKYGNCLVTKCPIDLSYETFVNNKVISVVIIGNYNNTKEYLVYNFNEETGLKVSNKELLTKANLNSNTILEKVDNSIINYDNKIDSSYVTRSVDYFNNLSNSDRIMFIDDNGLSVITRIYTDNTNFSKEIINAY